MSGNRLRLTVLASLFAALTAAGAFIRLPFPYVPITMQTLFVLLAGALLGPRFGAASQLIYLVVGLSGVPVFANGGGPAYVLQPTFGYLLSYPAAAYVTGRLLRAGGVPSVAPGLLRILLANLSGLGTVYLVGVAGLFLNMNIVLGQETTLNTAIKLGVLGPLPAALIKVALATILVRKIGRMQSWSMLENR